jgi:hypothetical protein
MAPRGAVAEWLGRGLQSLVHQFDSGRRLLEPTAGDSAEGTGYAARVREARELSGRDPAELAAALGMSYESYRDIESYDDEITGVVSFREVVTLGKLIRLDLRRLFGADDKVVTFEELADAIRARLRDTSLEQLEDEVGWELAGALADPTTFSEFTLDGLADVSAPFGIDWRQLLPR